MRLYSPLAFNTMVGMVDFPIGGIAILDDGWQHGRGAIPTSIPGTPHSIQPALSQPNPGSCPVSRRILVCPEC